MEEIYFNTIIGDIHIKPLPLPDMSSKYLKLSINEKGYCTVDVLIWDSHNNRSLPIKALIDTGATMTVINPECIANLKDTQTSQLYSFKSVSDSIKVHPIHQAKISFDLFGEDYKISFNFMAFKPLGNIDMIIGTNILSNFKYGYNIPETGKFFLETN